MMPENKIKEVMRSSPLFEAFDEGELNEFVEKAGTKSYQKGDVIVREGEKGSEMFFILEGEVEVFTEGDGERTFLDILKAGDFFGEFSFFTGGKRQATVKALKYTECLIINEELFEEFAEKSEKFSTVVVDFYKIRVLDTLLAHTEIFKMLNPDERKEVLAEFSLEVRDKGSVIVKEGDEGDALYVIKSGKVEVTTSDADGNTVKLAELGPGDFFGEVSLITGRPRTATVKALSKVRLMKMSKESFERICEKYPQVKFKAEEVVEKRAEDTLYRIILSEKKKVKKP